MRKLLRFRLVTVFIVLTAVAFFLAELRSRQQEQSMLVHLETIGEISGVGLICAIDKTDLFSKLTGTSHPNIVSLGRLRRNGQISDEQLKIICAFTRLNRLEFLSAGYPTEKTSSANANMGIRRIQEIVFESVECDVIVSTLNALISNNTSPFRLRLVAIDNWNSHLLSKTVQEKIISTSHVSDFLEP